jgi:hypothetical protein
MKLRRDFKELWMVEVCSKMIKKPVTIVGGSQKKRAKFSIHSKLLIEKGSAQKSRESTLSILTDPMRNFIVPNTHGHIVVKSMQQRDKAAKSRTVLDDLVPVGRETLLLSSKTVQQKGGNKVAVVLLMIVMGIDEGSQEKCLVLREHIHLDGKVPLVTIVGPVGMPGNNIASIRVDNDIVLMIL